MCQYKVHKLHQGYILIQGLSSPWIPDGWKQGGVVSNHCPVYTELYTNNNLDKGDLSSYKDVPLVEFMCLVFTRMPGESYHG